MSYSTIPPNATLSPTPFTVNVPEQSLTDLSTLLRLSKLPPATYESSQEDRKYGVTMKWMEEAKEQWQNSFNW